MIDNVSMAVTLGVTARDDTEDIGHTRVYGHSQAGPAKDISDNYLCSSPRDRRTERKAQSLPSIIYPIDS